ncbi:methyl-accepting chemotaxis protein [Methylobacterium organophilum]|uniref:Methyl-accepting chemotaxis protein n=1 Tax=Methylobacterium organophilum TaxID=410 RepID=A0ABQ4T5B6_METOR|nr:methyl-accepting chemotaxis protein [Methylobacterium organophilum]GJE26120.1 hypothetical protein LKMONMHP_0966 [Methylobacterium organophilum]
MRISLGVKLFAVVGLLGLVALGIAAFAIGQASERQAWSERTEAVWNAGLQARSLAHAIEHAVVEATALYTAADADEARPRLAALQTALAQVERTREPFLSAMEGQLTPEQSRRLDLAVKEFVAYQRDTAELGLSVSPKAALIQATDEATVKNRERMVAQINALGAEVLAKLDAQREAEAQSQHRATIALLAIPAVGLTLGLAAAFWIAISQIQRPLHRLKQTMLGLAAGCLDETIPFTQRRDEMGEMAQAIAAFQQALIERRELDLNAQHRQAEDVRRASQLAEATRLFEAESGMAVAELARSAEAMQAAADTLSETASETTGRASVVADSSSSSAGVVNSIAGAAEQLSSSAGSIADQVRYAREIAGVALTDTTVLGETVESLSKAATEIGSVVALIRSVADQTNLLALNATIEAARAGAAGRGFAVVAAEVKALAGQTALATDQIVGQVGAIQAASMGTAEAISSIRRTVAQMTDIATEVAAAAGQQGQASQEIAQAIGQAAMEVRTVSENVAGVRAAASSNETQAAQVRTGALRVGESSASLQASVATFLSRVHAA